MKVSVAMKAQHQNHEASLSGLNPPKVLNGQLPSLPNLKVFQFIYRVSLNSEKVSESTQKVAKKRG